MKRNDSQDGEFECVTGACTGCSVCLRLLQEVCEAMKWKLPLKSLNHMTTASEVKTRNHSRFWNTPFFAVPRQLLVHHIWSETRRHMEPLLHSWVISVYIRPSFSVISETTFTTVRLLLCNGFG